MQGKQKKNKSSFPDRRLSMFLPKIKKIKRKKELKNAIGSRTRFYFRLVSFLSCVVLNCKKKERKKER